MLCNEAFLRHISSDAYDKEDSLFDFVTAEGGDPTYRNASDSSTQLQRQ